MHKLRSSTWKLFSAVKWVDVPCWGWDRKLTGADPLVRRLRRLFITEAS